MATQKFLDQNGLSTLWTKIKGLTAPYALTAARATYAASAGYAQSSLTASRATTAGFSTTAARATYAASAGYATTAARATYAASAGYVAKAADSDKLDGLDSTAFATAGHTHILPQESIQWSGGNTNSDVTPIEMAMSSIHSANRLMFANPAGISAEYSTDGGSTWKDYGLSNDQKISLVSGLGTSISIGKKSSGITVNDKFRITINATSCGMYTACKRILLNVTTNGAGGANVKLEYSNKGSETTFKHYGTYSIGGWSGWNAIPFIAAFGGGTNQTGNAAVIRLTFGITSVHASYSSNLSLLDLQLHGATYWAHPSGMAKTNHLYSWDTAQNATFPADVYATNFRGTLIGSASQATTAGYAITAARATYAASAGRAGSSTTATRATYAASAGYATTAARATTAGYASNANQLDGLDSTAFATAGHTHAYLSLSGGTMSGNLTMMASNQHNSDQYINFKYSTTDLDNFSWRLGYRGTGSGNDNNFMIQSNGNGAWVDVLKFGLIDYKATFAGNVTAASFTGNLTGTATNATTAGYAITASRATYAASAGFAQSSTTASYAVNADKLDGLQATAFATAGHTHAYATQTDINTAISNLINGATSTLDTLNELAKAIGNDPNYSTTILTALNGKLDKSATATIVVGKSITATEATHAASAGYAGSATTATRATYAASAGYATTAAVANKVGAMPERELLSLVPRGTQIATTATNLNTTDMVKVGKYFCSQNAMAATLKNCPIPVAFMMDVYSPLATTYDNETTGKWVYRLRKLTRHDNGVVYTQACQAGATAGVWTYKDWYANPMAKVSYSGASASCAVGSSSNPVYVSSTGIVTACTSVEATKLSTVSKTAWGQTFWTSGGVPTSISGNITGNNFAIYDRTSNPYFMLTNNNLTGYVQILQTGEMCIGSTSTKSFTVAQDGSAVVNGTLTATKFHESSDETLKNFKEDINVNLDELSKLPKKYFTWKKDENGELCIGTSAQELQKLYPELVDTNIDGTLTVDYNKLSIIALAAIDKLNDKNKELEERLEKVEKILSKLNIE